MHGDKFRQKIVHYAALGNKRDHISEALLPGL